MIKITIKSPFLRFLGRTTLFRYIFAEPTIIAMSKVQGKIEKSRKRPSMPFVHGNIGFGIAISDSCANFILKLIKSYRKVPEPIKLATIYFGVIT